MKDEQSLHDIIHLPVKQAKQRISDYPVVISFFILNPSGTYVMIN